MKTMNQTIPTSKLPNVFLLLALALISFSCKKDKENTTPTTPITPVVEIKDATGNKYDTVRIGAQTWINTNLATRFFRNGDKIHEALSVQEWEQYYDEGKPCIILYRIVNGSLPKYGFLYNWYAITDPRGIAPQGFKIPSKEDFESLEAFIKSEGHNPMEALKSKEGWFNNQNGTDVYGFGALAGGEIREISSSIRFMSESERANCWSLTTQNDGFFFLSLGYDHVANPSLIRGLLLSDYAGLYVRCIKE